MKIYKSYLYLKPTNVSFILINAWSNIYGVTVNSSICFCIKFLTIYEMLKDRLIAISFGMVKVICSNNKVDTSEKKFKRFGETANVSELFKSVSLSPSRPYYNKETLKKRMDDVRKSIVYIRENWDKYDEFNQELRKTLKDTHFSPGKTRQIFNAMFDVPRNWATSETEIKNYNFDVIKLYTSDEGYDHIFSQVNKVFRNDSAVSSDSFIRSMVFLIELLNIDLFNYCMSQPKVNNFQGIVFRGIVLPEEDLKAFKNLLKLPISDRYIAVPLGILSSSENKTIAVEFIKGHLKPNNSVKPLICKIHVIQLKPSLLEKYKKKFPTSVVSTICAVDIKDISFYKRESEILLRGPFFQVLRVFFSKEKYNLKFYPEILEMVMVNANRDHISTMQLGDQSDIARRIFGIMVAVTRIEFALQFCKENKMKVDERAYSALLQEKEKELDDLLR